MNNTLIPLDTSRNIALLPPELSFPERPLYIFAHGSSKGMDSPFMETIAGHLRDHRINVLRFNFPYIVAGKGFPDRAEILEDSWRTVIRWANENLQFTDLYIGGKSMGARIATAIASEVADLEGLIFLGYPLHPAGKFDHIRDLYLQDIRKPMLFIQGTRDSMARMDLLQQALSSLRDYVTLQWIEGGDHSYKVLVRTGQHYPEILEKVGSQIAEWIDGDKAGK